jgi:hypothetical protein
MYSLMVTSAAPPPDDEVAWDWVHGLDEEGFAEKRPLCAALLGLVDALTAVYPETTDENGFSSDACVWAEGPLSRSGHADVLWLSISGRHERAGVQQFVIATANRLGLTVFDTVTSEIHRPRSAE